MTSDKSPGEQCPVARSLARVGERWSILILREVFNGRHRFDQFEQTLGIAPNMLSTRLAELVEAGLLEKRLYQERPARYGYHLTACGEDFRPVLYALLEFGSKYFAPEGRALVIVDKETGTPAEPELVDKRTGLSLSSGRYAVATTPVANAALQARHAIHLPPSKTQKSATSAKKVRHV